MSFSISAGALAAYRAQSWQEAIAKFDLLLASYPADAPAQEFLRRSRECSGHPPPRDWDGIYVMESK